MDDMGVWHNNRIDATYFTARIDEAGVHSVEKFSEPSSRRYKLVWVYRNHGTNPRLKKTTACIRGKLGNWQVSVPFPMLFTNGNAKRSRQYTRTKESTKQKLIDQLKTAAPKLAVDQVYESKGGILKAKSGGDLPRDLPQAYDLKTSEQGGIIHLSSLLFMWHL